MKLSTLTEVSALERQRALLIDQRDNGRLAAQLISSARLGNIRTDLGEKVLGLMRSVVVAHLDELIEGVDQELRSYGIQVDL